MPPKGGALPVPPWSMQASTKIAQEAARDCACELHDPPQMVRYSDYAPWPVSQNETR